MRSNNKEMISVRPDYEIISVWYGSKAILNVRSDNKALLNVKPINKEIQSVRSDNTKSSVCDLTREMSSV